MTEPAITPELIETGARALARHDGPWDDLMPGTRTALKLDAEAVLRAVIPLIHWWADRDAIDRDARVDELGARAHQLHLAWQKHRDRGEFETAAVLSEIADDYSRAITALLSAPTEEN